MGKHLMKLSELSARWQSQSLHYPMEQTIQEKISGYVLQLKAESSVLPLMNCTLLFNYYRTY